MQVGCFLLCPDKICPRLICKQAENFSWGPVLPPPAMTFVAGHPVFVPQVRDFQQRNAAPSSASQMMDWVNPEMFFLLQERGACAGASPQQASRISVRRQCRNAAVGKLFNSLGFALLTCSSKAEGKVCVRGMRRAEAHGIEASLLL